MSKKILALMMASVLLLGLLSGCGKKEEDVSEAEIAEAETYFADIEIADYGTITVELDAKSAPITVENFVAKIDQAKCVGCQICVKECPVGVIHVPETY